MTVYNAQDTLGNSIKSVISQSYTNLELIIVNDGSTDLSGRICDEYALEDERITVIHSKNEGAMAARDKAIKFALSKASNNDYVMFLDADDTYVDNAMNIINSHIMNSKCDLLILQMQRVVMGKNARITQYPLAYVGILKDKKKFFHIVFENPHYNALWRKVVSVKLLTDKTDKDFYYLRVGEDLLRSLEIYDNAKVVLFVEDVLYNYTYNEKSITANWNGLNYRVDSTVERIVHNFVLTKSTWSKSDFETYYEYIKNKLLYEIFNICKYKTPKKVKMGYLRQIKNDEYYKWIINSNLDNKVFSSVVNEKYNKIVLYSYMNRGVTKLKKIFCKKK